MKIRMAGPIALMAATAFISGCSRVHDDEASAPSPAPKVAAAAPQAAAPQAVNSPAALSTRDAITDSIITSRVKAGILSDPGMAGSDVSVNTDRGVVSLTGIIKSQEQAAIASAHAQRQDGVMRVDNELAVNLH